jgi:DNA-binding XRE family transcriptional regulator
MSKHKTSDALEITRHLVLGNDPERLARAERFRTEMDIGQALYNLRDAAGLTQQELADRVGTSRSVISRIEDADYEGHSMPLLRRIAAALGKRVVITFENVADTAGTAEGPAPDSVPPEREPVPSAAA